MAKVVTIKRAWSAKNRHTEQSNVMLRESGAPSNGRCDRDIDLVTVALPKLFAERLADLTKSPALLGVIAAVVYVFGAMTRYTIGRLRSHIKGLERHLRRR